jgi:hypothetical protein
MKKFLFSAMVLAIFAGNLTAFVPDANADDAWKGPGWYVVAYQYAVMLWSGPYVTREACEQVRPAENDPPGFSYDCSWFDREPGTGY